MSNNNNKENDVLNSYIDHLSSTSHQFVDGDQDIKNFSLEVTKLLFDKSLNIESESLPYINDILSTFNIPSDRIQTRQKRKRDEEEDNKLQLNQTPLDALFIDGFKDDQIWHQLDLRAKVMCGVVEKLVDANDDIDEDVDEEGEGEDLDDINGEDEEIDLNNLSPEEIQALKDEGFEFDGSDDDQIDDDQIDDDDDQSQDDNENEEDDDDDSQIGEISYQKLRDEDDDDNERSNKNEKPAKRDVWGLDNAFFSIDDFNRMTEDQEVNERLRDRSKVNNDDNDDDEEDEDVDLFSSNVDSLGDNDEENANDIYYQDFFDPPRKGWSHTIKPNYSLSSPPRKKEKKDQKNSRRSSSVRFDDSVKVQKIKNNRRNSISEDNEEDDDDSESEDDEGDEVESQKQNMENDDDEDQEMMSQSDEENDESDGIKEDNEEDESGDEIGEKTIDKFNSDLFAEDEPNEDEEEEEKNTSTYNRRKLALSHQIADLEDENVAEKEWTMRGEISSRARPENSLLAEDLNFETTSKAIPEVTEEKTQTLEELIKRRILDENFDDVIRVREVNDKPFLPSRLFELDDKKATEGLGDIYANEYSGTGVNVDEKLKAEHDEIEEMWNDISSKLDSLSNSHFTPKAPKANIETVSNTASISLESALPSAQSTSTVAAPEEVYNSDKFGGVSRDEMTTTEKRSQRNKIRKSKAKDRQRLSNVVDNKSKKQRMSVADEKREALKKLTQGKGVTVVGKGDTKQQRKGGEQNKNAAALKL